MRGPLESFDMTMQDFRLLEMLYREGALAIPDVARKLGRVRQDVHVIATRLQERGWVRRMMVALPAVEFEQAHVAKTEAEGREGPRVGVVMLTRSGKGMIGNVLPEHAKVVRALMHVLDARAASASRKHGSAGNPGLKPIHQRTLFREPALPASGQEGSRFHL